MSILESLFTAFFCISVVFALLGSLYVLVSLSTEVIKLVETKPNK